VGGFVVLVDVQNDLQVPRKGRGGGKAVQQSLHHRRTPARGQQEAYGIVTGRLHVYIRGALCRRRGANSITRLGVVCEIFLWRDRNSLHSITYGDYAAGDCVMEGRRVSAQELKQALSDEWDHLAEAMAEAMNAARDGRIIADSEEPVRDAHAVFRQQMFQKALGLLQGKQEAFSPSGQRAAEQRQADHDAPDDQRTNRD
jgi:hypothetical protein